MQFLFHAFFFIFSSVDLFPFKIPNTAFIIFIFYSFFPQHDIIILQQIHKKQREKWHYGFVTTSGLRLQVFRSLFMCV